MKRLMTRPTTALALGFAVLTGTALASAPAMAGPCSDQIAEIGKALSQNASLGPPTTGALAGSQPGTIKGTAAQGEAAPVQGQSQAQKTTGEGGMKEMNAASGQVATSAQDVRLQQKGEPTVAQGGNPADTDRMGQAKMHLDQARLLDSQNSQECTQAVEAARKLMTAS